MQDSVVCLSTPPQPLNNEMKKQLEKILQGFLQKNQVLKLDIKVRQAYCSPQVQILKLSGWAWFGWSLSAYTVISFHIKVKPTVKAWGRGLCAKEHWFSMCRSGVI